MDSEGLKIDEKVLKSFEIASVFNNNTDRITCLDFDESGQKLISSSLDLSMNLYDVTRQISEPTTIYSKKYGCDHVKFTHKNTTIVHASTKGDEMELGTLRYLSLHDNKYLRYFRGHENLITSVQVAPKDDLIMTASLDKTVRLWDLRSVNCQVR